LALLGDKHFIGLYSGTMSNKQGLESVIEAAKILDQSESNIRFVLCGDGPHKKNLESLAIGLKNVQFLGLQTAENFSELLHTADVHLIPQLPTWCCRQSSEVFSQQESL
jgi:colanic acid biosynthesis glycosyl transferase WcaI